MGYASSCDFSQQVAVKVHASVTLNSVDYFVSVILKEHHWILQLLFDDLGEGWRFGIEGNYPITGMSEDMEGFFVDFLTCLMDEITPFNEGIRPPGHDPRFDVMTKIYPEIGLYPFGVKEQSVGPS